MCIWFLEIDVQLLSKTEGRADPVIQLIRLVPARGVMLLKQHASETAEKAWWSNTGNFTKAGSTDSTEGATAGPRVTRSDVHVLYCDLRFSEEAAPLLERLTLAS